MADSSKLGDILCHPTKPDLIGEVIDVTRTESWFTVIVRFTDGSVYSAPLFHFRDPTEAERQTYLKWKPEHPR